MALVEAALSLSKVGAGRAGGERAAKPQRWVVNEC